MAYDTQIDPIASQGAISSPVNTTTAVVPTTITPSDVYSEANIASSTSGTATAPDDLLGIRNQIYSELGIPDAINQYNSQYAKLLNLQNVSEAQQLSLGNQAVNLNVIRGEQATAQELANYGITAQSRATEVAGNKLNALKTEAMAQYEIRAQRVAETRNLMLQYPKAKLKWGDSIETISSKLADYEDEVAKDAYKKQLKAMAMEMGVSTKGSRKELEKRISKYNKSALRTAKIKSDLEIEAQRLQIAQAKKNLYNEEKTISMEDIAKAFGDQEESTVNSTGTTQDTGNLTPDGSSYLQQMMGTQNLNYTTPGIRVYGNTA